VFVVDELKLKIVDRVDAIAQVAWDELAAADARATPFMSWTFLEALENSGCVSANRGWLPRHLTLWRGGRLVAVAPAYVKADSAGDFSRDWGFADFAQRAGLSLYPKLVLTVPFTPVPGRRILVARGENRARCVAAICTGAREFARELGLSGVQVLFSDSEETAELETAGLAPRVLFQFHWFNHDYRAWEDWLASLNSKRRHMVKRERRAPTEQGIRIRTVRGEEIQERPAAWARQAYRLYCSTADKYMWGGRYLDEAFFARVFRRMPEYVQLVEARRNGQLVAGALNVVGATRLFGRYWGCREEIRFLHFNVCLYHPIQDCIQKGIRVFEGGMGGEHKLLRGFEPVLVHGAHSYIDPRFDSALRAYLEEEMRVRKLELAQWQARKRR
jgi:predicted N-acyltransferase